MYDHSLHRERKHFWSLLFTRFHYRRNFKVSIKDCFKINGKQTIKTPKKGEYVKFKNFEKKPPFVIYADFESILGPEDNGKQIENSTKCWTCDNDFIDNDIKERDHCDITGNYRGTAHRDCNINVKLNHNIPAVFHNLKNYDSYLIMQELGKFNLKINVIPNGLEKYMSFSINNKLSFIDSFQFLSSSLDSLVKDVNNNGFKYLSQEFDNNISDLVKKRILSL